MAETMNMKELFALLVRRCRAVLLTALIFAVLLGGAHPGAIRMKVMCPLRKKLHRSMPILQP